MNINYDEEVKTDLRNIVFGGYSYLHALTKGEKLAYDTIKKRDSDKFQVEMKILEILLSLGFSFDQCGTHFLKDLIIHIHDLLEDDVSEDLIREELNNDFSQIYFDVARNDLDIGIKTFHEYVGKAYSCININNINLDTIGKVFNNDDDISIKIIPLTIAKYIKELKNDYQRIRKDNN